MEREKGMMRPGKLAIFMVVGGSFFCEGRAQASECTTDEDCHDGEVCIVVPCPPCDPEKTCPQCEDTGVCTPISEKKCEVDADCPKGFICNGIAILIVCLPTPQVCSGVCFEDGHCELLNCPEEDSPRCASGVIEVCAYEPQECSSDSDCEPGFECRRQLLCETVECPCPKCECAPCPPDGLCEPCDCPDNSCDCPETVERKCEVLGYWCTPREEPCEEDPDCLEGWECAQIGPGCECPPCECLEPSCEDDLECPDAVEDDCICEPCDCPQEAKKVCLPKGWKEAGYVLGERNDEGFGSVTRSGGEYGFIGGAAGTAGSDGIATQELGASTFRRHESSSSRGRSSGVSSLLATLLALLLLAFFVLSWRLLRR